METTLRQLPFDDVLDGLPVREFRSWKGRKHYSGWYWSSTMGRHVVYESRLEMARILLADQDPSVMRIAAQPFLIEGVDDSGRIRRHVPDLLLETADAVLELVDVKSYERLGDPKVAAQLAWTRRVCDQIGLAYEVWSGADPVFLANLSFLEPLSGSVAESSPADECCGEVEESVVDVGAAFPSDGQSPVLV